MKVKTNKPSAPSAANRELIDMLSSLSQAGASASTSTPDVPVTPPTEPLLECQQIFTLPPEPISAEPQVDPTEQKVLAFIHICHVASGLTYREIASGTSLLISDVRHALDSLVANGTVKDSGEPEPNYRRYRLAVSEPESPAQPAEDLRTSSQIWDYEQRQRVIAEEAAKLPPQPKRWTPSEESITEELAKRTTIVLTPEEKQQLKLLEGRTPRSPQAFIQR